ncbi:MAG: zf-HC2 domain-containing protein [Candidatus Krumholzibacteriia bacterium]
MRCGKARAWVSLDLDGSLPPDRVVALEGHLSACSACRAHRDDLLLGRRMLAATTPTLSDQFDWRLRSRLNQSLTAAARDAAGPWQVRSGRGAWSSRFGTSAALGAAAVLTVALFLDGNSDPVPAEQGMTSTPSQTAALVPRAEESGAAAALDRRPLFPAENGLRARLVSSGGQGSALAAAPASRTRLNAWSGDGVRDLETITELRQVNERLARLVRHLQGRIDLLEAQLDTTRDGGLDLQETR